MWGGQGIPIARYFYGNSIALAIHSLDPLPTILCRRGGLGGLRADCDFADYVFLRDGA